MATKPNEPAQPRGIQLRQSLDPAQIPVLEHEIQVLQAQKQAINRERADIAEQTKKAAELSRKAEEKSALVQRGLAKSPPDPNPPRIGAAADQREQKALRQYRSFTLADRSDFVSLIRSRWLRLRDAATDVVANAPELRKRRTLLNQVGLLASEMREHVRDSIVARVQSAKDVKDAESEQVLSWAIADMRADLYRAVLACSLEEHFSFDTQSQLDQQFYYKLATDWAPPVWAGYDPGLNHSQAPAWAAEDDGRTLTKKFALARKYASGDAEIATLERAEKAGRCTPGDTLRLLNEIAGELGSAIEYRARPDALNKLLPLMARRKKSTVLSKFAQFTDFAGPIYDKALRESPGHRVSKESLKRIGEQLANSNFPEPLEHLERSHRTQLGNHNKKHPRDPIKTWPRLISSSKFQGFARKALNRAASKFSRNIAWRSF